MKNRKSLGMLFAIPVLMFGFGYLMVPIYDIFCDLTGLNGKTGSTTIQHVGRMKVDETRLIKVEFMAALNKDTPLDFAPTAQSMVVHPGKTYRATYTARNRKSIAMTGQAVPSVAPSAASAYFNKTECFCFGRQPFAANEQRELPLVFVIHPNLPANIQTLTLSYTFFEVDADAPVDKENHDHDSEHNHAHDDGHDHTSHAPMSGDSSSPLKNSTLNL